MDNIGISKLLVFTADMKKMTKHVAIKKRVCYEKSPGPYILPCAVDGNFLNISFFGSQGPPKSKNIYW